MKAAIAIALVALVASNSAFAANTVCDSQVAVKKLSGAEKDSFMKECEAEQAKLEMTKGCDAQAKEKKLAGAAMMSFVNKCVKDAEAAATVKK